MSRSMMDGVEWKVSPGLTSYADSLAAMEARAAAIRAGTAPELVWLVEHPPIFTAGTSADPAELFNPHGFAVAEAGRGGRYTYHGPGQRVGYLMLDLEKRGRDIRHFVHCLEGWMIDALGALGVDARRECGRIGIWTGTGRDRGQDRRNRGARETLGDNARLFDQRRARPDALFRHRPVRHRCIMA